MRIGLLTGGGDVPGLNAVIRAVVKHGTSTYGHTIVGFRNGWRGVVDGDVQDLSRRDIRNVLAQGGTMLGTARFHPHSADGGLDAVRATLEAERIEALICVGGDGTMHAAHKVAGDHWSAEWEIPYSCLGVRAGSGAKVPFNLTVRKVAAKQWIMWQGTDGWSWQAEKAGLLQLP